MLRFHGRSTACVGHGIRDVWMFGEQGWCVSTSTRIFREFQVVLRTSDGLEQDLGWARQSD